MRSSCDRGILVGYINRAFWTKEETGLLQTEPLSAFALFSIFMVWWLGNSNNDKIIWASGAVVPITQSGSHSNPHSSHHHRRFSPPRPPSRASPIPPWFSFSFLLSGIISFHFLQFLWCPWGLNVLIWCKWVI